MTQPRKTEKSASVSVSSSLRNRTPDDFTLDLSENARVVLERRYLRKDEDGQTIETPVQMFRRVAENIALAERRFVGDEQAVEMEETFFRLMTQLDFLPNSPTLMNAGRELQQLSACFVLPVQDSIDSIFNTIRDTALIHKSGGGTGFGFSRVRPKDDRVQSTSGVASGPVSFMQVFDSATEAIKQGGTRRGANMAILRVDHPDIIEFITCKDNQRGLNNFNISVALTDAFMEAVKNEGEYPLVNPRTGQVQTLEDACKVFDLIVKQAWKNGEPGIVFIDRVNNDNPTPHIGEIESTNPCGEQPLLAHESCNLGSLNLANMVRKTAESAEKYEIDYDKLDKTIGTAVRFLDDVIEMNCYPLVAIQEKTLANRKIGLGVMGFADLLIKLGIPYNSEQGIRTGEKLMAFIDERAVEYSRNLAEERGAFPNFRASTWDTPDARPIRNATVTTIAPTGTISIIAGCSSGVEPLFAVAFKRRILDGDELTEVHPILLQMAKDGGFYSKELMEKIAEHGHVQSLTEIPAEMRKIFVTAHDVTPDWHVKMQAAFQKHTHNAVSKTINFPTHATMEDVHQAYELAYNLGCKGITVYRDGSRDAQVLSIGQHKTTVAAGIVSAAPGVKPRPRPLCVTGRTIEMETGCGSLYVTINEDENGRPFEVFAQIGKAGGCVASQTQSTARLCSLALRSGIDPKTIVKQLIGISCHKPSGFGARKILSCSDAIAKAMKWYLALEKNQQTEFTFDRERGACPDCGGVVEHINGCETCRSCGYSECS
jgi:ribonucleoside-diphosphate reductase alpha chain